MVKITEPNNQVYWYKQDSTLKPLQGDMKCDVVVIGGGMSGLSAAQAFCKLGLSVILLEKNYCGSGATGKSTGFITPDSEIPLDDFEKTYGFENAKRMWELGNSGVEFIRDNIKKFDINCLYQELDSVVLANSERAYNKMIVGEHETRLRFGYPTTLYNNQEVKSIIGSDNYYGGIRYGGTFGINAYLYCEAMKSNLIDMGVKIFEDAPAIEIGQNVVKTRNGSVSCEYIIMCCDYAAPELGKLTYDIYHMQNFVVLSEPLTPSEMSRVFPGGGIMAWDTDLLFNYFRPTLDNRIVVGGVGLLYAYSKYPKHRSKMMYKKLTNYFYSKFPDIKVNFEYMWPGMLGMSKDIFPIAGRDPKQKNLYYVAAVAGLPWAAALGNYSAEHLINGATEFDHYFSPQRDYFIGEFGQKILGTKLSFALSNFMQIKSHIF